MRRTPSTRQVVPAVLAVLVAGGIGFMIVRPAGTDVTATSAPGEMRVGGRVDPPGTPPAAGPAPAGTNPPLPSTEPPVPETVPGAGPDTSSTRPPAVAAVPALVTPVPGRWTPVGTLVAGSPAMYTTQVTVGAAVATAVWVDPHLVRFQLHPGGAEPGGTWSTPSSVSAGDQPDLLAAFNSGFKMKDSHGGFFLDGKGAASLHDGAATFTVDRAGTLDVGQWGRDHQLDDTIVAARQNLTLLVDGGQPAPTVDDQPHDRWGGTLHGAVDVWRSGVGVTANGAVLYLAGPALNAKTLAAAFVGVGAVRAMELDINHAWVTFNTYRADGAAAPTGAKLLPAMSQPANRYLAPDSRDFVAVLARPDPSAAMPPPVVPAPTS